MLTLSCFFFKIIGLCFHGWTHNDTTASPQLLCSSWLQQPATVQFLILVPFKTEYQEQGQDCSHKTLPLQSLTFWLCFWTVPAKWCRRFPVPLLSLETKGNFGTWMARENPVAEIKIQISGLLKRLENLGRLIWSIRMERTVTSFHDFLVQFGQAP